MDEQAGAQQARSGLAHAPRWQSVAGARDAGRQLLAFGRRLFRESIQDRLPGLAAEIAFFAVLGVFPALLLASGLLGVLDAVLGGPVGTTSLQRLVDSLDALLTPQAAPLVESVQNLLQVNGGQLLSMATLGGLITISGAFAVVVEPLNLAYDAVERRSWLHRRLLGLAMGLGTVLAAALVLSVIVLGPGLGLGRELAELVGLGGEYGAAWTALRVPVLAVGLVVWTATLFWLAPSRPGRFRDQLPGRGGDHPALDRHEPRPAPLRRAGQPDQPGPRRPGRRSDRAALGLPARSGPAARRRAQRDPAAARSAAGSSRLRTGRRAVERPTRWCAVDRFHGAGM